MKAWVIGGLVAAVVTVAAVMAATTAVVASGVEGSSQARKVPSAK